MKVGERYSGYDTVIEIIGLPGAWDIKLWDVKYKVSSKSNMMIKYPLALFLKNTITWKLGNMQPAAFPCNWKLLLNQDKPKEI